MKPVYFIFIGLFIISCNSPQKKETTKPVPITLVKTPELTLAEANRLAQLPLRCMETEYPNKLGQTLGSATDLNTPKTLHPAFYGCFDWHSAVHGHWSLVKLLKEFPDLDNADTIRQKLLAGMSKEHILAEVAYFNRETEKSYERTYGWAWLLKLAEELHTWNDPMARQLETNLQPLTDRIVQKYIDFLPKLNYPVRVGEHPNTAFGLSFAYDYAKTVGNEPLRSLIEQRARDFYSNDIHCPLSWEPGGTDFLSPCLEEAAIMKRVLPMEDFVKWMDQFLPQLKDKAFDLEPGIVSDRTDGKLVHLDGVNFSRAWDLNEIAKGLPEYQHLKNIANKHINYSLPAIVDDHYEGGHWLGTFAIYALSTVDND